MDHDAKPAETRWDQLQRTTRRLASQLRRRAQRARLQAQVARLESRIEAEKARIGKALYPLVEDATITTEIPEVQEGVEAIAHLRDQVRVSRERLEELDKQAAPVH